MRPHLPVPASARTVLLTAVTMVCFAGNSLLARLALREGAIDGGTFTAVRILSGALALLVVMKWRSERDSSLMQHGSWSAALALFSYALAFSFAYLWLDAGMGALILFAAVQMTMIGAGIVRGERPKRLEWVGLIVAIAGLIYLVSPGLSAPPWSGAILMAAAGASWGGYSLAAKGARSPLAATASNFSRATPMAAVLLLIVWTASESHATRTGLALAVVSGAITSGMGYAIWYMALRNLTPSRAAIVQLTVPVIAALGAVIVLHEQPTWRLAVAGVAILGGVGLALFGNHLFDETRYAGRDSRLRFKSRGL